MTKTAKMYCTGTQRIIAPEDTLGRVKGFYKDFGITRVANITGLDKIGIPVVVAFRPNSRSLAVSQGKGITYESAMASAVMESIEGFHAERIFNPTQILSYNDLSMDRAVADVKKISRLATSEFDNNHRISWVQGQDLMSGTETWVPFECVHTDYTDPWPHDHGKFVADSNGLASGNSLCEAINHGLFEVIERDALALWSLKNVQDKERKKVKLKTIPFEHIIKLIDQITSSDINIAIWDITSDIEIPTYICKILESSEQAELRSRPAYGSGTHINAEIAMSRAITEAAQSRLTFISGSRDDQYKEIYESQVSEDIYNKWHHDICLQKECFEFMPYDDPQHDYIEDDQEYILKRLEACGLEQVIYVDLTRDTYDIPVVKVIVPGLEGISFPGERILGERGHNAYKDSGVGACVKKH